MPTSLLSQWSEREPGILWLLKTAPRPAGRVLDVGPGHGKASVLLPEYVRSVSLVDAVEAAPEYVEKYGLEGKYGCVWPRRFEEMEQQWLDWYDSILMVDVIEHMPKPTALAAIERCRGQIVICTPVLFEEAWEPGLPETERHVSAWEPADFAESRHRMEQAYEIRGGYLIRLGPLDGMEQPW